jgi:hypothetical protein
MIGNHIVVRTNFGFDAKLNRITGLLRCDALTSRFADKSALIEDDAYYNFNKYVKEFIVDEVIPKLTEYEDVLITKEESRIYREIDKVLGQAVIENLESVEVEEEEYETVEDKVTIPNQDSLTENASITKFKNQDNKFSTAESYENSSVQISKNKEQAHTSILEHQTIHSENEPQYYKANERTQTFPTLNPSSNLDNMQIKKIKTLKRTFALKKIGYKVIPYEDESDSRYGFTTENVVFVNKANSAYKAESERGDEFLLRHIIRLVAEAIAEEKHPEGKDALELQNRLIGEAIKIHNLHSRKK